jgi:hypothetical protein
MEVRRKITGVFMIVFCMVMFTATAFAYSYGDTKTIDVKNSAVRGSNKDIKETNGTAWHLYVYSKTMTSDPNVRLVNSEKSVRSTSKTVTDELPKTFNGTGNTGTKGYYYYPSVTPSAAQVGWDSIKLKVSAD